MKTPELTEAQQDRAYREYLYYRCPRHGCPLDECDCFNDVKDILEEMNADRPADPPEN